MSPVRPVVQVVGRRLEPEDHLVRDFLTRTAQPHEWLEAGSVEASELLGRLGLVDPVLPVVVDGAEVVVGATVQRLASAWGQASAPRATHYDLAIVGPDRRALRRRYTPPPTDSRRSCWIETCRAGRRRTRR